MVTRHKKVLLLGLAVALIASQYVGAAGVAPVAVRVGAVRFWEVYDDWASYPDGRPELAGGREYISRDYDVPYPYDVYREVSSFTIRGVIASNQALLLHHHRPDHTGETLIQVVPAASGADTVVSVSGVLGGDIGHYSLGILCAAQTEADGWAYIASATLSDSTVIPFDTPDWSGDNSLEPDVDPPAPPVIPPPAVPTTPADPTYPSLPDPGKVDPPAGPGGTWPGPGDDWGTPWPDIPIDTYPVPDPLPGDPGGPPAADDPTVPDPLPGEPGGLPAIDDPADADPLPGEPGGLPAIDDPMVPDDPYELDPVPAADEPMDADPIPTPDDPYDLDPVPAVDDVPELDPLPVLDPLPGGG